MARAREARADKGKKYGTDASDLRTDAQEGAWNQ